MEIMKFIIKRESAKNSAILIIIGLLIIMNANSFENIEKRGQIASDDFLWEPMNFPGFYYDIDNNIGTESLRIENLSMINNSSDYICDAHYLSKAQPVMFKYNEWGSYYVIGFLGEKYFSGYVENNDPNENLFFIKSPDENPISESQLPEILIDNGNEIVWPSDSPFELEDGYAANFDILNNDDDELYISLTKNGRQKYGARIETNNSDLERSTFFYKGKIGSQNELITIAIHVKNILKGERKNYITVQGVWQLSEYPYMLKNDDDELGHVNKDADDRLLYMDSDKYRIVLRRGKTTRLTNDFYIKTSDKTQIFRYYPFSKYLMPGNYEVRSTVATESYSWDTWNFGGLYYDIDEDIGTEKISTRIKGKKLSGEKPYYGIIYETKAQPESFKCKEWGKFNAIGFMGEKFFAGYIKDHNFTKDTFCEDSDKCVNMIARGKLLKILNDSAELDGLINDSLKLDEGYVLRTEYDIGGNKLHIQLMRYGDVVDDKVICPSIKNTTIRDQTYIYLKSIGKNEKIPIIAVLFRNSYLRDGVTRSTIGGVWQLSETFESIGEGNVFDKMTVLELNEEDLSIQMVNKDQPIRLDRNATRKITYLPWKNATNDDISLMKYLKLKTSDSNDFRYYIFNHRPINSTLNITTDPSQATISIDNVTQSTTPSLISTAKGDHKIKIIKKGYKEENINISIKNMEESIYRKLTKICTLTINPIPSDADILVDDKPITNRTIQIDRDKLYRITVKHEGYNDSNSSSSFLNCSEILNISLEKKEIPTPEEGAPDKSDYAILTLIIAVLVVIFRSPLEKIGEILIKKLDCLINRK